MVGKIRNSDIAKKLGLSATLVSLVLNNKGDQNGIKKDTQEKVIAMATQMGYFQGLREKDLKSPVEEKPGAVGILTTSVNDPLVVSISPFLQKIFAEIGISFSIIAKDGDDLRYKRMIIALTKFYSGLILAGDSADEATINTLRSINYPVVVLERKINNHQCNTVTTDLSAAVDLATSHIEKLGYKNILILADEKNKIEDQKIIDELTKSLQLKTGINKPFILEIRMPGAGEGIDYSLFAKYLKPPHSVELIITLSADLVYKLYSVLQDQNKRIPGDIAILSMEEGIGFDLFQPTVTCLRKAFSDMALKTARLLWGEIKNSGKSKYKSQLVFSPVLIEGGSC